jgi:hypothetical protein
MKEIQGAIAAAVQVSRHSHLHKSIHCDQYNRLCSPGFRAYTLSYVDLHPRAEEINCAH